MTVDVFRADTTRDTVFDRGFDFTDQRVYQLDTPVRVEPGDALRTSCSFENDTGSFVTYGENTGSEMCFNFVLAYPPGSLNTGSLTGGNNRCME